MNLKNLERDDKNIEQPKDTLGGGGLLESGVYDGIVELAFLKESQAGAMGVELHIKVGDGHIHRETVYVTNRNGENFYEKNGKKHYLPGFVTVDELAAVTCEVHVADLDTEDKVVKLYDFESQEEKPTEVPMFTDMLGKKAKFAIVQETDYKTQKGDDGKYHPIDETRSYNVINKVFNEDGFTVLELMNGEEEPEFIELWKQKNEGVVRDRTKGKSPKAASGAAKSGKPSKSLFKKKD